jgi:hypothetical protein
MSSPPTDPVEKKAFFVAGKPVRLILRSNIGPDLTYGEYVLAIRNHLMTHGDFDEADLPAQMRNIRNRKLLLERFYELHEGLFREIQILGKAVGSELGKKRPSVGIDTDTDTDT